MLIDLVQTQTRDGIRLDGAWREPKEASGGLHVDALCLVHGTGANFYASTFMEAFSLHFVPLGCGTLVINTRGHDGISTASTLQGGKRLGAAYEVVDDCRHDLRAWLDFLKERGCRKVALVGHSLGAVKALYAMSLEPHPLVAALVAISPPRLSYASFAASKQGELFLETYRQAELLVQQGRPSALMEVQLPLPMAISAEGYLEKYGPREQYNYLQFFRAVDRPTFVVFGEQELQGNMAFQGCPELLADLARKQSRLQIAIVPGADHFYTGKRPELLAVIEPWLRGLK